MSTVSSMKRYSVNGIQKELTYTELEQEVHRLQQRLRHITKRSTERKRTIKRLNKAYEAKLYHIHRLETKLKEVTPWYKRLF